MKAGHRAWQLFAYPEAQQHFERAAELRERVSVPEAPPYWELLRRAAHSARYAGDFRAALAHLRRALASAETDCDALTLGRLHGELSESLWLHGQSDEAVEASDRSLEVLPDEPSRERADALGWRSRLLMLLGGTTRRSRRAAKEWKWRASSRQRSNAAVPSTPSGPP